MIICIENLPWFTTSEDVRKFCLPFGEVLSSAVKFDSDLQQSQGYGLVEMSEVNCHKAIKILDGLPYHSCHLKVRIACN